MMKYLLLFSMLFCAIGCNSKNGPVTSVKLAGTRQYEVFGMDCPGCHGGLEKLVKKIPAVHGAQANWVKKELVVTVEPGEELSDEDVYDAIKRANLTAGNRIN